MGTVSNSQSRRLSRMQPGSAMYTRSQQRFYERGEDEACGTLTGIQLMKPGETKVTIVRWAKGRNADLDKLLIQTDDGMLSWCWWDQLKEAPNG